ncbi:MAG: TonB-dependent receptor [Bacteroides sp.]|nr:TonB-dependent receptor [Bacteroides sp.]
MLKQKLIHCYVSITVGAALLMPAAPMMAATEETPSQYAIEQESRPIKGTVSDAKGNPIIGVNVVIKGTGNGTITDIDGNFSLNAKTGSVLLFSYIGYVNKEVKVTSTGELSVTLIEDAQMLDELVVVGYGTAKRSDLTGSVSSVTSKDIEKRPVTNLASALQGQVPGVVISNVSGAPGAGLKFRVRGANSIIGSNDPLYVVDGVVLNIGTNELNVGDIESVEVLKDASATAIYGSRGANGVVLITTKRGGKEQPTRVRATANVGVAMLPNKYDLLSAGEFAELANVYRNDYFSADQIAGFKKNGGVDWQDEVFQTGITQSYDIGVSGGSPKTTFYISGNYIDQTGIVTNTDMQKYSFRSNVSTTVGEKLKIDLNMTAARTTGLNTGDYGSKGSPVWLAPIYSPTFAMYDENGNWNRYDNLCGPNYANPAMTLQERHSDYLRNTMSANTKLSYQIINGLKLDVLFGVDNISTENGGVSNAWISSNPGASLSEEKTYTWQNSNILTYEKTFANDHNMTLMAANEQTSSTNSYFSASGSGIDPISVGYNNLGLASTKNIASRKTKYSLQSFFGRAAYSYKSKYMLTATFRADGTSKFQGSNKWGYFPSAAAAWRVSEEAFMKDIETISNLKLRGSWGITGNQGVNPYATIAVVSNWSHAYGQGSMYPGTYYTGADNPNLKWETTAQTNVGFDIGFFNGRLGFSFDYYYKKTSDLLLGVSIPSYDGGGRVNKNVGDVENKGVEFTITATPIDTRDLRWDISGNFSSHRNKVVDLGDEDFILSSTIPAAGMFPTSPFALKVGESLGSFYGYRWEGIYKSSEAAEAAKFGFKPGDNKYANIYDDGVINSQDQEIIGSALPKFVWGLDNTVTWKDFSLNVMVQGSHGSKVLNTMYAGASTILSDATAISSVDGKDFWTPQNENAKFQDPTTSTGKNFIASTQFLQDGSYVKVKNIGLSYNLDKAKTKFADLKFTVSAQNLFTFTKYKGYDPEASTTTGDVDGAVDLGAYPNPKTITFGVQMTF